MPLCSTGIILLMVAFIVGRLDDIFKHRYGTSLAHFKFKKRVLITARHVCLSNRTTKMVVEKKENY